MAIDYSIKILLAEDSKFMRRMEVSMLRELGFTNIVEVNNGQEGLAALENSSNIGLIISDWNMPVMNGYDFLVSVRDIEKCKNLPFIMASARGEKENTVRAIEAGVNDFIVKPFDKKELKKIISYIFEGRLEDEIKHKQRLYKTISGKRLFKVGHIQITDHLVLGVLKHLIAKGELNPKHFELETECMSNWNYVRSALEDGEVDACCILAPIAMNIFSCGTPIKLVLFAHKNGSIAVRKKIESETINLKKFLKKKAFCIPHQLSIHHMLMHMFLRKIGLNPGIERGKNVDITFEVVPPIQMPTILEQNDDVAGFMVAEPLGTKAIASGVAKLLYLSGELWKNHPCCVIAMRDETIKEDEQAVQEFVSMLVKAGKFIAQRPSTAAKIAVDFLDPEKKLGLQIPVLKNVLEEEQGIKTDDLIPVIEDLEKIQSYMVKEMHLGTPIDLNKFVETKFAKVAYEGAGLQASSSLLRIDSVAQRILTEQKNTDDSKAMLNEEGEYLIFKLDNREYGIKVTHIKEIIENFPIREVALAPEHIKGLINLRGEVITVTDLKKRLFKGADHKQNTSNRIIVLEIKDNTNVGKEGILVDSVSEVIKISANNIRDPKFDSRFDSPYIKALALGEDIKQLKLLIDTEKLFAE